MRRRLGKLRPELIVSVTLALLLAPAGWGCCQESAADQSDVPDDDAARVAREIEAAVAELQTIRRQRRREAAAHHQRLEVLQRQIDALSKPLSELAQIVEAESREIERLKSEIAQHSSQAANARAWIKMIADTAIPVAEKTRTRIEQSAGRQKLKRTTSLAEAVRQLGSDEATQQVEGLRGLLGVAEEEWIQARNVTLVNEEVSLEGGNLREHAWVVSFGMASKVFVSEDGGLVGLWSGDAASPWQLELQQDTREQIRAVVDIVREKRPPSLAPLPVLTRTSRVAR